MYDLKNLLFFFFFFLNLDSEMLSINRLATKEQRHSELNQTNLFAKGLKEDITEEKFRAAFERFGTITSCVLKHPTQ
jgi:RNA recognition motif-containing protein